MGKEEHYQVADAKAESFLADNTIRALDMLIEWLRFNPDISPLAITITRGEGYEEVTVFYE